MAVSEVKRALSKRHFRSEGLMSDEVILVGKKLWRTLRAATDICYDYRGNHDKLINEFVEHCGRIDKLEHELMVLALIQLTELAQRTYEDLHGVAKK